MELGNFVSRAKFAPFVRPTPSTFQPTPVGPGWPLMLKDTATGEDLPDATFMVSYLHQEEKGSDVNVGTHLLLDVPRHEVDAAVMVSNDSDLKLPVRETRRRVPLGIVRPGPGQLAGDLRGSPSEGAGGHWWGVVDAARLRSNQLPEKIGVLSRPDGW